MKPYSVFKKGGHGHSHDHAHVGMKMSESEEEEYYNSKGVGSGGHDHEEAEDQKRLEVTSPFLGRTDGLLSLCTIRKIGNYLSFELRLMNQLIVSGQVNWNWNRN